MKVEIKEKTKKKTIITLSERDAYILCKLLGCVGKRLLDYCNLSRDFLNPLQSLDLEMNKALEIHLEGKEKKHE